MFVFGNFLLAVSVVLNYGLTIYMWILIINALLSWVNPDPYNPIVRFLYRASEPVLRPIRRTIGVGFGLDISPLIAILGIWFIKLFLVQSLRDIALRLR